MGYSPIVKFRAKNFRNLGDVTISFEESPIVVLSGENECGKTSTMKAFDETANNSHPRSQSEYIRTGTNGWGGEITLADGTVITRIKSNSSNRVTINYPDGTEWEANKSDGGNPQPVQDIMGIVQEPDTKEYLQIRTYEDQMLLVTTPASTNYKVVYNALKVDNLTRAIKLGSTSINELRSELNQNEIEKQGLIKQLKQIRFVDLEPVINIRDRITIAMQQLNKLELAVERLVRLREIKATLGALELIQRNGLVSLSIPEATTLSSIYRVNCSSLKISSALSNLSKITTIGEIEYSVVNKLWVALGSKVSMLEKAKWVKLASELTSLNEVSVVELARLGRASELSKHAKYLGRQLDSRQQTPPAVEQHEIDRALKTAQAINAAKRCFWVKGQAELLDFGNVRSLTQEDFDPINKLMSAFQYRAKITQTAEELKAANKEKDRLSHLIADSGAIVTDCPNCGEAVVIDPRVG